MKIYFCEKCGVSIPLQEVVGGRATARDGKTYCQNCHPGVQKESGELELYFCDNCGVSIPLQDVITNRARSEGDKVICTECSPLSVAQRSARRERIRQELEEKEESRYRLHFCDRCNTSIPQSHLITGRAVMQAGRTYCERCKPRAASRRSGTSTGLLAVLLVLAIAAAGYFALGGRSLLASGPSEEEKRAEQTATKLAGIDGKIDDLTKKLRDRDEGIISLKQRLHELETRQNALIELEKKASDLQTEIQANQKKFESEVEGRLDQKDSAIRDLEAKLAGLAGQLEVLKSRPRAEPVRVEPKVEEKQPEVAKTEPEPAQEDVPNEVQQYIDQLGAKEEGRRFAAAVELGRRGHPAAIDPLIQVLKNDSDYFVRRAAARSLGAMNTWRAVPALIDTLGDKEYFVAIAAHQALKTITGQDFGFRENMSRSETRKVIAKAKDWWKDHENDR